MKRVTITAVFDVNYEKYNLPGEGAVAERVGFDWGEDELDTGWEGISLVSSEITVTDPPREWKFGDVVTKDDHPDRPFIVVGRDGESDYCNPGNRNEFFLMDELAPFRLVAIDGKVLD